MKLVLENQNGQAVRTFFVEGEEAVVIQRKDTRRLEVHTSVDFLQKTRTPFDRIGNILESDVAKAPVEIAAHGRIRLVNSVEDIHRDPELKSEGSKTWYASLTILILMSAGFLGFVLNRPSDVTAKLEQEMKQELVQIVKKIPPPPKKLVEQPRIQDQKVQAEHKTVKPTKQVSVKRLGALSVLGSLAKSSQKGGVNLGSVNTTAGPGLGGTAGSGGVQTTLYGKGLVAAPVGAGSNLQGGGGYGTKGKGGGQAGYGKLSLIGSAGTAAIPLGREALIEGGLDRDLIADVISRNMGQVRFCYEQALQGDPSLAGRVAVQFTINGTGQVKIAGVESTTLNSKLVEDCILLRLKSWKFPLPEGGVDVKVSYPFVLRRAGQG